MTAYVTVFYFEIDDDFELLRAQTGIAIGKFHVFHNFEWDQFETIHKI